MFFCNLDDEEVSIVEINKNTFEYFKRIKDNHNIAMSKMHIDFESVMSILELENPDDLINSGLILSVKDWQVNI